MWASQLRQTQTGVWLRQTTGCDAARGLFFWQCFPGRIGDPSRYPHILHLDSLKTGGHRLDDIKMPLLKWLTLEWQEKRGQGQPADAPKFNRKVRSTAGCVGLGLT